MSVEARTRQPSVAVRPNVARGNSARRVADSLRQEIIVGHLPPGSRLREERVGERYGVSRNTLREAFRLLEQERLLGHDPNRGVFVRSLDAGDVIDLYFVREVVEVAALRRAETLGEVPVHSVVTAVERGQQAAVEDRWDEVGTEDLRFHLELVRLAHSPRLEEHMAKHLAELRLAFHAVASARTFHEPYLARNRRLLEMIADGDLRDAAVELRSYLRDARDQLLEALAGLAP